MTDYRGFEDSLRLGIHTPRPRTIEELLIGINFTLEQILAELQRTNSIDRTGAVSSVEVKWTSATKDVPRQPAPAIKCYAGSEPPVQEAFDAYTRLERLMMERPLPEWEATIKALRP